MACSCLTYLIRELIHKHGAAVDRAAPKLGGPVIDAVETRFALADVIDALIAVHLKGWLSENTTTFIGRTITSVIEANSTGVPQVVSIAGESQADR